MTYNSINWNPHSSCLHSLPDFVKCFSFRFIHHYLPTGKISFDSPHHCPYCNLNFTLSSLHDHSLSILLLTQIKSHAFKSSPKLSLVSISFLSYNNILFFPIRTYIMSNNPLPHDPSHYPYFLSAIYTTVPSLKQKSSGLISFEGNLPIPLDL